MDTVLDKSMTQCLRQICLPNACLFLVVQGTSELKILPLHKALNLEPEDKNLHLVYHHFHHYYCPIVEESIAM